MSAVYHGPHAGIVLTSGFVAKNPVTIATNGTITGNATGYNGDAVFASGYAWTITNLGTVNATGSTSDGVVLQASGEVTNGSASDTTALISGTRQGVVIRDGGTVTNFGTIESAVTGNTVGVFTYDAPATVFNSGVISGGADGHGIYFDNGGRVTNGSSGSTAALIEGGNGMTSSDFGGAATLTNFGTVDGTGFAGVWIEDGGTVTNFGIIEGTGTAFYGVDLLAGGRITNGSSSATKALITGYRAGISVGVEQPGTVINFGTISATGTSASAPGAGISLAAGGTVTNGSTADRNAVISSPGRAISIGGAAGGSGTVTNYGTIKGTTTSGVELDAGGAVVNHGLVAGGSYGVYFGTTSSAGKVVNSGTITGVGGFTVGAGNTAGNALTNSGRIVGRGGTAVAFGGGNDVLTVGAGAVFKGAVEGGGGKNKLVEGSAGVLNVTGFSGFETIVLADGGADTLTLKSANFTGLTGTTITVDGGDAGNTFNMSGLAAADPVVLVGGPGNDVFYAGGDTKMTGGLATNEFIFTAPGTGHDTIEDFAKSTTNELVFSNSGFDLGLGGSAKPQPFSAVDVTALFSPQSNGTFTNTTERLAYDTSDGKLFFSSDGSGSSRQLVATLADHASISTHLFYISGLSGSG